MLGGYQSESINKNHLQVIDLNTNGKPKKATNKEQQTALNINEGNIGIGMRGTKGQRYGIADEGMMLYSALPHKEIVPLSWQGPSPNMKLLLRRNYPVKGPFALRVKASKRLVFSNATDNGRSFAKRKAAGFLSKKFKATQVTAKCNRAESYRLQKAKKNETCRGHFTPR